MILPPFFSKGFLVKKTWRWIHDQLKDNIHSVDFAGYLLIILFLFLFPKFLAENQH